MKIIFASIVFMSASVWSSCSLLPAQHSAYRTIHQAVLDGSLQGVKDDLSGAPADLELRDDAGRTPLELAVEHCHIEIVRFLIVHHANVEARAKGGATPLHLAAQEGCVDAVALLLAAHADINARDDIGRTPLTRARQWHQSAIIPILQADGALP